MSALLSMHMVLRVRPVTPALTLVKRAGDSGDQRGTAGDSGGQWRAGGP